MYKCDNVHTDARDSGSMENTWERTSEKERERERNSLSIGEVLGKVWTIIYRHTVPKSRREHFDVGTGGRLGFVIYGFQSDEQHKMTRTSVFSTFGNLSRFLLCVRTFFFVPSTYMHQGLSTRLKVARRKNFRGNGLARTFFFFFSLSLIGKSDCFFAL